MKDKLKKLYNEHKELVVYYTTGAVISGVTVYLTMKRENQIVCADWMVDPEGELPDQIWVTKKSGEVKVLKMEKDEEVN